MEFLKKWFIFSDEFLSENIIFTVLVSWKIDEFRTNIKSFPRSGSKKLFKVFFVSKNSAVQQLLHYRILRKLLLCVNYF